MTATSVAGPAVWKCLFLHGLALLFQTAEGKRKLPVDYRLGSMGLYAFIYIL